MGMCKGCKEVVSALEIKKGLCEKCQVVGAIEIIEQNKKNLLSKVSIEKLKHDFYTEDNRILGIFLMLVGVWMLYMSIQSLAGAVFGSSILVLTIGFIHWQQSKKLILKIYTDCIEVENKIIDKEKILKIEVNKNICTIFIEDDMTISLNLKRVTPYLRENIPQVLESFISGESIERVINKEPKEKRLTIISDEEISDKTHKLLTILIISLLFVAIVFLFIKLK